MSRCERARRRRRLVARRVDGGLDDGEVGREPLDDFFGHDFGDRFGHRFFEHDRRGAVARLLDVLDAFFADARHDVFDDVVGELHRLEHEDEVVLGEVPASTTDREQRLEALDRHTFWRWTDRSGRLVNLTHSCRPFQRARLATGPRLRGTARGRQVHRGHGVLAR